MKIVNPRTGRLINIDGKTALNILNRVSSAPARLSTDPICEDIIVNIRTFTRNYEIPVNTCDKVIILKRKIKQIIGIPVGDQIIKFDDDIIGSRRTILRRMGVNPFMPNIFSHRRIENRDQWPLYKFHIKDGDSFKVYHS